MKICSTAVRVTGVVVVALVVGVPASGQERLSVTPTSVSVQAAQGETPPSQTVEIKNDGNQALKWSVSGPSDSWLSVSPRTGVQRGTVIVSFASNLGAGTYSSSFTITTEESSSATVSVQLTIGATAVPPPPPPPLLRRPLARARAHGRRSRVRLVPSTSGPVSTSRALSMSMRARRRSVCAPACII